MFNLEDFSRSVLWFSLGLILNRIKYILLTVIVAALHSSGLSVFYISFFIINEVSSFANRLVSSSYNRFLRDKNYTASPDELNKVINSSLQISLMIGLVSSAVIFMAAEPLAFLIKSDQLASSIKILSLALPFIVLSNQVIQMLTMLTKLREAIIFHYFFETILVLGFAYISISLLGGGMRDVLIWQVGAAVVSAVTAGSILYVVIPRFRLTAKILPVSFKTNPVILLNGTALLLFSFADVLAVGFFFGYRKLSEYVAILVGPHLIYAMASTVFAMYLQMAYSFKEDIDKLTRFSQKVMQFILILLSLTTLLLMIYPQQTLTNLIHINIGFNSTALVVLSLAFFIRSIGWMAGQILIVSQKSSLNAAINALIYVIAAPLYVVLIQRYGILGAAYLTLFLSTLDFLVKTFFVYSKLKIWFISRQSYKIGATALVSYFIFRYGIRLDFYYFLALYPALFLGILIIIKAIRRKDLIVVKQALFRKPANNYFAENKL